MDVLTSSLHVAEDVMFSDLGDEAVMLHLPSGKYFGLDEVGRAIWLAIPRCGRVEGIVDELIAQYDTDRETLRGDVIEFVELLASRGLVRLEG